MPLVADHAQGQLVREFTVLLDPPRIGASADRRNHVRFWKVLEQGQENRPVWLGSATFDRGGTAAAVDSGVPALRRFTTSATFMYSCSLIGK